MFENLSEAKKLTEPKTFRAFHREALTAVEELKSKEAQLIAALQNVDEYLVYRYLGFNSLFRYCVDGLKLSEYQAVTYISVARKAKKLPSLQSALDSGEVSVSKVSRVVSVMNEDNQLHWLNMAKDLSKHEIEKEVAKINPRAVSHEKARFLTDTVMELQVPMSEEIFKNLKKVQDLMSQKSGEAVKLERVIEVLSQEYLAKHDPVKRYERRERRQKN